MARFNASMRAVGLALALAAGSAAAQQAPIVYPANGQSRDQQARDERECQSWAVQQSGFNPANPGATASGGSGTSTGREVLRGGARGAAAGAAIGAIAGDAGRGAAIGATAGGMSRGMRQRDEARNAPPPQNPAQDNFNRAWAACLEGRGYSVR